MTLKKNSFYLCSRLLAVGQHLLQSSNREAVGQDKATHRQVWRYILTEITMDENHIIIIFIVDIIIIITTLQLKVDSSLQSLVPNPSEARQSFTCSSCIVKVLCKTTSSPWIGHTHTQISTNSSLSLWRINAFCLKDYRTFCWLEFSTVLLFNYLHGAIQCARTLYSVHFCACELESAFPICRSQSRICLSCLFWCRKRPETTAKTANTSSPHGARLHIGKIVWGWPLINLSFHSTLSVALWNQSNKPLSTEALCGSHMTGSHTTSSAWVVEL